MICLQYAYILGNFGKMINKDRIIRKFIPSVVLLSRSTICLVIFRVIDFFVKPIFKIFTKTPIPPLKYIIRTGVGNNVLFPHYYYLTYSYRLWIYLFSMKYVKMDSVIIDIGCGVGKGAVGLRDFSYCGESFKGMYYGYDVEKEMIDWCRLNFPDNRFRFSCLDFKGTVYNPNGNAGAKLAFDLRDNVVDLVLSQSLFSHLLEEDIRVYLEESFRVLKSGGIALITFFCFDDLMELNLLGGRWTFQYKVGSALVENVNYPEAAVAYPKDFMVNLANSCGFRYSEVILPYAQSTLKCVK